MKAGGGMRTELATKRRLYELVRQLEDEARRAARRIATLEELLVEVKA